MRCRKAPAIRAAEGGVVAYAGNELKGYGNLVLIRHAGGYVTAYAHAKELLVKRGDTVERGDVIAKAGQTGAVSSPQLHFEVRKGATALDPIKYLASSNSVELITGSLEVPCKDWRPGCVSAGSLSFGVEIKSASPPALCPSLPRQILDQLPGHAARTVSRG